nr:DNA helicase [Tanacetum cinerariifolium]
MKTKRKLVPKDVVMGNVGEPQIVGVTGSCVSHVGEGSRPSVPAGSQLECLVGRVVDGRDMGNINDVGLCSASNVIDDVGCSFHVDEFIGTRGLQTLVASSSANRKRTRDVMSKTTTSNVGSSSSSTRRRLHSGRHSANTCVSNDDSVFLTDTSNVHTNDYSLRGNRTCPPLEYKDVEKCDHSCEHCGARFWPTATCQQAPSILHGIIVPLLFVYGEDGYSKYMKMDWKAFSAIYGPLFVLLNKVESITYAIIKMISEMTTYMVFMTPSDAKILTVPTVVEGSFCHSPLQVVPVILDFPGVTTADRADIVDCVFEMKIHQFVKYLRDRKTFLWKTIIYALRVEGKIVLSVSSSGIASLLLPSDLIVWDESPMNDQQCFETLDRTLRDILDTPTKLFGGKPIMLGGDFRQTLPALCFDGKYASHPRNFIRHRKKEVSTFAERLLNVGDGTLGVSDDTDPANTSWIEIPS